jgi:glycosyltransferase involved in cell wall biosynthesis
MTKIGFTFSVNDFSGASKMGFEYAKRIVKLGNPLTVFIEKSDSKNSLADKFLEIKGVKVVFVSGFNKVFSIYLVLQLAKLIRKNKIDVLVSMNQGDTKISSLSARLASVKYVAFVQNKRLFHGNYFLAFLKKYSYYFLLSFNAFKIICVSDSVKKQHLKNLVKLKKRIVTVENGIPLPNIIKTSDIRSNYNINENDILIINTGRISEQKGQDVLIKAIEPLISKNKNIKLLLCGGPTSNLDAFYQQILTYIKNKKLQDNIFITGWQDNVYPFLVSASIYVQSSRWEGPPLPLSVLEAMYCNLPTIITDCSGIPTHFTKEQIQFVVKVENIADLREAIERVVKMGKEKLKILGRENKQIVEKHYDINITSRKFISELLETSIE